MNVILYCVMVNSHLKPVFPVSPKSAQLEPPEVHSYCLVHFYVLSYMLLYYIGQSWDVAKLSHKQEVRAMILKLCMLPKVRNKTETIWD
jgi:hypothetical protein